MKTPLWIINSILVILLILTFIFIFFSLRKVNMDIKITSLEPLTIPETPKSQKLKEKDIKLIYEGNDLFGTYSPQAPEQPQVLTLPDLPKPPNPKPVLSLEPPAIQFLEPLPITLTGIISHSNESKSQVTVVDNNTKKSTTYKVGDKLFDAYVIRIFPRKIILIRSNGQQETLYMSPKEAEEDINKLKNSSWADVVQQISNNLYEVNITNFAKRVKSLAELIEMLDLTTAFSKGSSIGCRIGKIDDKSIGYAFGFLPGDIIISIGKIAPTTTTNRVNIYNKLYSLNSDDKIKVEIIRNGKNATYEYQIKEDKPVEKSINKPKPDKLLTNNKQVKNSKQKQVIAKNKKLENNVNKFKTLQRNFKVKPQVKRLKSRDKQAMLKFGNKRSVLKSL